jgi:predicted SprT family Zn-dependent metalloprotease
MPLLRQLEFTFGKSVVAGIGDPGGLTRSIYVAGVSDPGYNAFDLETTARELLRALGAARIATVLCVEWNSRLKTTAGRADYRRKLISLNPRLREHPAEIDRTLRHELAHILAQFRAGRGKILPHGDEWHAACRDLGIADEKRCHNLPFPATECARRYVYKCPNCKCDFYRARRIRRGVACLACCRAYNGGEFDARFRLRLVSG